MSDTPEIIEKCQAKLIPFARAVYPGFDAPIHIRKIAEALEEIETGANRRLIITVPPRHGKSLVASQIFPAWYAGKHPRDKILLASNTHMLAADFGRNCRNIMQAQEYQMIFPDVQVSEDSRAKNTFKTNKGGELFFLGVGGTIVGRGCHVALVDDPIKDAEQADSEVYVKKLHDWYREVLYTRQMPGGKIIIIMQRWRSNDLIGWLTDPKEQELIEDWKMVDLPAVATEDTEWRKKGEALWPQRYPVEELEKIRIAIGTRSFNGLYQQRPSIEDGDIIHRDWLPEETCADEDLHGPRVMFVDSAFKDGQENDYSAGVIAQQYKQANIAILYAEQQKLQFPALIKWIKRIGLTYKLAAILVEDKASGPSIVQTLNQCINDPRDPFKIPVILIPVKRGEDKIARMNAITPMLESKRVIIHKFSPALQREELITNLLQFPNCTHDDLADSFCGVVTYIMRAGMGMRKLFNKISQISVGSIFGR